MDGGEGSVVQPEARHEPGAEVLDNHVRPDGQVAGGASSVARRKVEDDGSFVPVEREEVCGVLADERWPPPPRVVAGARAFHLHHVGTQVGQDHGGQRPREDPREIHHSHPGEGRIDGRPTGGLVAVA
jgi:hypothetical protein